MHRFANPAKFTRLADQILPWAIAASVLAFGFGLYYALLDSPADYQQGESVRMMYVHVPAAWSSMFIYLFIAVASFTALVWKHPLALIAGKAAAPIGATFTALALITGSLWGKPMWGTWWVWDARLTSELILLFLYIGVMALYSAFEDEKTAAKAAGLLAIVGVVNLPIIHFSVEWWNTLHQPATLKLTEKPSMDPSMLWPLLIMIVTTYVFFVLIVILRTRNEILWHERKRQWVRQMLES